MWMYKSRHVGVRTCKCVCGGGKGVRSLCLCLCLCLCRHLFPMYT